MTRALQISCNTAFADLGLQARRERAAGPGREVRLRRRSLAVPDAGHPEHACPPSSTRRRPRSRRSASSTCGSPRCRWPWSPPAIANQGQVMQPYLVEQVRAPDLSVISTTAPTSLGLGGHAGGRRPADPDDGGRRRPTAPAQRAQIDGRRASPARPAPRSRATGKPPHAWFIAFAPADNPQVAVAVVVEDGGKVGQRGLRRHRRRPDRQEGHGGGARQMSSRCSVSPNDRQDRKARRDRHPPPARRTLRGRRAPRPRRDGRGAHRPRHPARPQRRDQDAARRPGPRPAVPDAVPPRGPVRRVAEPPGDRRGLRQRRGRRRPRPAARASQAPYIVMEYVEGRTLRDLLGQSGAAGLAARRCGSPPACWPRSSTATAPASCTATSSRPT